MVEDAGRKVYVGGDGGYDGRFKRVREQFGQVDLALLENGQYNNDWPLIHSTPEGLEHAIMDLQAKAVFTVHHDKFALAKHPWSECHPPIGPTHRNSNIFLIQAPNWLV